MRRLQAIVAVAGLAAVLLPAPRAFAQGEIKIGLVAEFSGPFAHYGQQIQNGMKAYVKQHGDMVAGKKVVILTKDATGPAPDLARRLTQEFVTQDKVDFLAGYGFTPNAMAAAQVATEGHTPLIVMNAAGSAVTTRSPYIVRFSMTLPQVSQPMALWASKNGIKRVFSVVSDFAPGIDSETAFVKAFTAGGGEIVGSVRVPLQNPDFGPFVQRVKDAKPDAAFVFVPAGEQSVAVMKSFVERGLREAGVKLIGPGDMTDDDVLESMGEPALGVITSHHYSAAHDSPENKAFVKAYDEVSGGKMRPNFMAVGGYDGMAAIYETARQLGGRIDSDKAIEILKRLKLQSPRGSIAIDPETRDIVQSVYIRRVEKIDGHYYNVEFDRFADLKDPGK